MKKQLFVLLTAGLGILGANNSTAQLQKGNLMVGGSLADMNIGLQKGNTDLSFSVHPRLGYFVADNLAIGAKVNLGFATNAALNSINYGIGAFGRYYVSDQRAILLKSSRFFAEVDAGITGTNLKPKGATAITTNGFGFGFGPGVSYFITPNVGLEALLKYNLGVGFGTAPTTNNFSFGVGFQIYLPTKKARSLYNEAAGEIKQRYSDDSED